MMTVDTVGTGAGGGLGGGVSRLFAFGLGFSAQALAVRLAGSRRRRLLGRPGLDLARRELCIIAACVAGRQDRQLVSHLHGAINVGAPAGWVDGTLEALRGVTVPDALERARMLWARVQGK